MHVGLKFKKTLTFEAPPFLTRAGIGWMDKHLSTPPTGLLSSPSIQRKESWGKSNWIEEGPIALHCDAQNHLRIWISTLINYHIISCSSQLLICICWEITVNWISVKILINFLSWHLNLFRHLSFFHLFVKIFAFGFWMEELLAAVGYSSFRI